MTEINKTQADNKKASQVKKDVTSNHPKKDKNTKEPNTAKSEAAKTEQPQIQSSVKKEDTNKKTSETHVAAVNVPAQPKGQKSGFGLSILAISMVLALGGGTLYLGKQESSRFTAEVNALNGQITLLKNQQQQTQASLKTATAESQKARDKLQILLNQQDNSLSSLQSALIELRGRRPNDWLLAEADHLVKQAGRQLWIEKDLATTMRLVETADQRIAQLNDPSLTPIRQALANDLQTLKSVERIDSDGIVLRIASLQAQVNNLVLANALLAEEAEELAPAVVSEEISNWKENLVTSLKDFAEQFITYRKREGSVIPLLTPAQTFYLQENIKAKLAQAINSVYRENTELYLASLSSTKQWILDFYNLETAETQGFIQSITDLENQTIKINYPTELTSLNLISDEISLRLSKELSSLVSAARGEK